MAKGYPRTRFEIIDQSQIQAIETTEAASPVALIMAPYTSDKGTEKWELMKGLDYFTESKGSISFTKHGQAMLNVTQALRYGAYVFGKRLVADDATFANFTIRARVVVDNRISYVYYYAVSATEATTFEDACSAGYNSFDPDNPVADDGNIDVPLFTITAIGRGESTMNIRFDPAYISAKSTSTLRYDLEVYEGVDLLENISITMNPDIVIQNTAYGINPRIRANSNQIKAKFYDDGLLALMNALAETANDGEVYYPISELVNMDFINGYDARGKTEIGGLVTQSISDEDEKNLWTSYMPEDIADYIVDLGDINGIRLSNGSYGSLTDTPMNQPELYEELLLGALGADENSNQFDSLIYDVDAYKIDAIFDANWPVTVKNAIIDMVEFRGDMVFLCDLGMDVMNVEQIENKVNNITPSRYCALYHNYYDILDPYSKKEITVTMPYSLIPKLIDHMSNGVGRPFAGLANNIYFTEIIEGSLNFLPCIIPSVNQKEQLVDLNVNYLSYYEGTLVMETMYVNADTYTQLSYLHNILAVQQIIKVIRSRCPRIRYTFIDSDSLEEYLADVTAVINNYASNFKSISVTYMADELYEQNNIFYAMLEVQFRNFVQEEYFKIIAIS